MRLGPFHSPVNTPQEFAVIRLIDIRRGHPTIPPSVPSVMARHYGDETYFRRAVDMGTWEAEI